jgi:hypothetical protein
MDIIEKEEKRTWRESIFYVLARTVNGSIT